MRIRCLADIVAISTLAIVLGIATTVAGVLLESPMLSFGGVAIFASGIYMLYAREVACRLGREERGRKLAKIMTLVVPAAIIAGFVIEKASGGLIPSCLPMIGVSIFIVTMVSE